MPLALHEGFIVPELKLACYTDHQVFERFHRFKLKDGFSQAKQALTLKEIYNLQKGDYVTHIDHGVGQFSGLQTIDVNGKPQEAIRLIYKDGVFVCQHSLFAPDFEIYGKEGSVPKMNKLGTQAWTTLKNKTKTKIKEMPSISFNYSPNAKASRVSLFLRIRTTGRNWKPRSCMRRYARPGQLDTSN